MLRAMESRATTVARDDTTVPRPAGSALDGLTEHGPRVRVGPVRTVRAPGLEEREGVQRSLARPVKVLQPAPDAPQEVADDLRAEARLLGRLDHPNILPIHAVLDDEDGLQVLVASVPGATWEQRLSQPHVLRDAFGASDVLAWHGRVLLEVCRAVRFAHEHGYLHRGISAEAVWIGDLGEVYLVDWALAVPSRGALPLARTQLTDLRSAGYQPPEMIMRSAGRVSVRTDVYQLGGLLYRILTGSPPHEEHDDVDEILKNVLFRDPPIPHDAPPPLARVCKRALSRNPEARYADVASFAAALEEALAQRGAWQIAAQADAHFDTLQRLLREDPVDTAAVYRTFGAVRLGYEQVLADAPELQSAGLRLDRAAEMFVQHLIEAQDLPAAEAVLSTLGRPVDHLRADIDEAAAKQEGPSEAQQVLAAHGRARDPRRDASRRTWLGAVLALLWVPTPLAHLVAEDTGWTPLGMVVGCVLLTVAAAGLARLTGIERTSSRLTRDLAGWAVWGTAGLATVLAVATFAGLDAAQLRTVIAACVALIAATGAFSIDGRMLGAAAGFGASAVISLAWPWAWAPSMFLANLCLAAVFIVPAPGPPARTREAS